MLISGLFGGLALSWAGSGIGACAAWLPVRPSPAVQAGALGLAAGVMIAAALMGLVPDALVQAGPGRAYLVWAGFLAGLLGLAALDRLMPHQHPGAPGPDHAHGISRGTASLIALALILHNIPEGMAVGVAAAAGEASPSGAAVVTALALHNVIEGLLVALPLRLAGMRPLTAFALGQAAGVVEVAAGLMAGLWLPAGSAAIPLALAAAGGAMVFLSFEELLPEALRCHDGNAGPVGAAAGVTGMMVLGGMLA
jgi:ZIP family zinc transporter